MMTAMGFVLGRRHPELVDTLVRQAAFSPEQADRFAALARSELVESIEWQRLRPTDLTKPSAVRDVLSTMHSGRIASALGMPRSEVWAGLRAFVPRALELADREARASQWRLAAWPVRQRRRDPVPV
jgi:hypothetical protein